jgi:hypothetical protein
VFYFSCEERSVGGGRKRRMLRIRMYDVIVADYGHFVEIKRIRSVKKLMNEKSALSKNNVK